MMRPATQEKRSVKVRAKLPRFYRRRFLHRHPFTGQLFYFEIVLCRPSVWAESAFSVSPEWSSARFGPLIGGWRFEF